MVPFVVCDVYWEMEFEAAMFVGSGAAWELESLADSNFCLTYFLRESFKSRVQTDKLE